MSDASCQRPWFRRKAYSVGVAPATWQGWLATAVFIVIFVVTFSQLNASGPGLSGWWAAFASHHPHHSLAELAARPDVLGEGATELIAFLLLARWKSSGPWFGS